MRDHVQLSDSVISNGYCIGCGACAVIKGSPYEISFDAEGKYQAIKGDSEPESPLIASMCPFSEVSHNEDTISKRLFGNIEGIQHDQYLGYHLDTYAGSVATGTYREIGTSGGLGTWLATKMLDEGLVDRVIHVRPVDNSDTLFRYEISSTREEVSQGSKSRYYPVEMSRVLQQVIETPGRYLLVGVPCFIKAFHLLSEHVPILKERIVFALGLVCGHLKTDRFAKVIGWQMGIHPSQLESIDFRIKLPDATASSYGVAIKGVGQAEDTIVPMKDILVRNWGHGLFRYEACDYCDDVLAETADITIGDAWLPEYVSDGKGTNIIVVRNPEIGDLIKRNASELALDAISAERVYQSQAGGFRHRREGLSYRLFLKDKEQQWRPVKRVEPSDSLSKRRRRIYEGRIPLLKKANEAFDNALVSNEFSTFEEEIQPALDAYDRLYKRPFVIRAVLSILRRVKIFMKKILKR